MTDARTVVIAGAGLAGFRTARTLLDDGFNGKVLVLGDEFHHPYDRPPLSKQLLAGAFTPDDCRLAGAIDDIEWHLGSAVVGLDPEKRQVSTRGGTSYQYDDLVIATGRRARPWPTEVPRTGVHTLRTLDDVARMTTELRPGARAVIIGSGFVGCEAAATLRALDVEVTITSVDHYPMPVMGAEVGTRARQLHEKHGVEWRLASAVQNIEGTDTVTGVRLSSGELLSADLVLVAIGSIPNTEWLADSGLLISSGVVEVDSHCAAVAQTGDSADGVWAVGDAASWRHRDADRRVCIEHWSNARDMADTVAANIIGIGARRPLQSVPAFWSDQYDVKIKSVGYLRSADEFIVVDENPERQALLVEARHQGRVVGAIALNMNKAIIGYQRNLRMADRQPVH